MAACRRHYMAMVIRFYSKSETHSEFSNFAPYGIDLDGAWWRTVEHYYQAQKFTDPELRRRIRKADKAPIVKNLSRKYARMARPDWDEVKEEIMRRAVRRKFELHPELAALLLSTGDEPIEEASLADAFWGVGRDGTGQNKLGQIIMEVRAALRAGTLVSG